MSLAESYHKPPPQLSLTCPNCQAPLAARGWRWTPCLLPSSPLLGSASPLSRLVSSTSKRDSPVQSEHLFIGKQVRLHLPSSRSSATFHHCLANLAEYRKIYFYLSFISLCACKRTEITSCGLSYLWAILLVTFPNFGALYFLISIFIFVRDIFI